MSELDIPDVIERLHDAGYAVVIVNLDETGCDFEDVERAMSEAGRAVIDSEYKPEFEAFDDGPDESMDGDHETALASAGFGTDEDYGDFGGWDGNGSPV
jgi:hypothetical protein